MPEKYPTCCDCEARAVWLRMTQFAGNHPFCDKHARAEKDFGIRDDCTGWIKIAVKPKVPDQVNP